jgi:SAM-dependent methyltransferase
MDVHARLVSIANDYPPALRAEHVRDARRVAFHVGLARAGQSDGARIADVGGGLGLFTPGCAALGMRATLIDDFRDPGYRGVAHEVLAIHRRMGVEVIERDVIAEGVDLPAESFDVITSFDSIEHWHHSPKRLFRRLVVALRPGGRFVLGAPNCVNLRKRLTVPFGAGKWSRMEDWYEQAEFRGHVREPDVGDLRYIAGDLALAVDAIVGRNWLGHSSPRWVVRAATRVADRPLRVFPSLCSDIYLVARKMNAAR